MTKLTYEEFKKACDAGMHHGSACCCVGAQGNDEWCPCSMNVLDILTEDGQKELEAQWRAQGRRSRSDWEAIHAEQEKDQIEQNPIRKKRLELMKQKGYTT